jgi:hypothetical protein
MHTTDEAKKLWCPVATVACADIGLGMIKGVASRLLMMPPDDMFEARPTCIADQCAMWRWIPGEGKSLIERIKDRRSQTGDTLASAKEWCERNPEAPASTYGYCGLAGKP